MAAHGDGAHVFAVINAQAPQCGAAQGVSLLQDRVKHRCQVAGRGVDDPQHFGGRGLSRQCLVSFDGAPLQLRLKLGDGSLHIA